MVRRAARLVGCPPFWHRKQMVMLRNIMEGKYTFGSPEWDDVTGEGAVFLTGCVRAHSTDAQRR